MICLALFWPATGLAEGGERILDFESRIVVRADATMRVTETIKVFSDGGMIKRGIFRDFPTIYQDRHGNTLTVAFKVLGVWRGERDEPYHTTARSNGVRLYIGQSDVTIAKGEHKYTIVYETDRQIGFFENFDELYWNVTGNGWYFPIEKARVLVSLPEGAKVLNWAGYTGKKGDTGKDFRRMAVTGDVDIGVATTRRLWWLEGLTISVTWPKGFVAEPSSFDLLRYQVSNNLDIVWTVGGFFGLFLYYLLAWHRFGRDPEKGTIVPEYDPPADISPAAARYLLYTTFDDRTFAAAILSVAVKGHLKIAGSEEEGYVLHRTGESREKMSPGEMAVHKKLFADGQDELALKSTNHEILTDAQAALAQSLRTDFERIYFLRNTGLFIPGLVLTALILIAAALSTINPKPFLGAAIIGLPLCLTGYFVWRSSIAARSGHLASARSILFFGVTVVICLVLLSFGLTDMFDLFKHLEPVKSVLVLGLIVLNLVFYHLLKAPTRLGRRVMDKIAGFALYLSVAESERMSLANPPERTPELFEKYLAYAYALEVDQVWGKQFANVLVAAGRDSGHDTPHRVFCPDWYDGGNYDLDDIDRFSTDLSSGFSGAIAAAASPPASNGGGSSSGGYSVGGGGYSGGGSSGGGGGGGGGGGW